MIPFNNYFQLISERIMPPAQIISKYENDPNAFMTFTDLLQPRGPKRGEKNKRANKTTDRLGINPLTTYHTPAGIYCYPIKAYYDTLKNYADIPYVKEKPIVFVFKARNFERVVHTSSYSEKDFWRDFEELCEIYPKYDLPDIHLNVERGSHNNNPLQRFWSITRELAEQFADQGKVPNANRRSIWTQILRRFFDGVVDDTHSSTIHPSEPTQAVFWNATYIDALERIDRTQGGKLDSHEYDNAEAWRGEGRSLYKNDKFTKYLIKYYQNKTEPLNVKGLDPKKVDQTTASLLKAYRLAAKGDVDFYHYITHISYSIEDSLYMHAFDTFLRNAKVLNPFLKADDYSKLRTFPKFIDKHLDKIMDIWDSPRNHATQLVKDMVDTMTINPDNDKMFLSLLEMTYEQFIEKPSTSNSLGLYIREYFLPVVRQNHPKVLYRYPKIIHLLAQCLQKLNNAKQGLPIQLVNFLVDWLFQAEYNNTHIDIIFPTLMNPNFPLIESQKLLERALENLSEEETSDLTENMIALASEIPNKLKGYNDIYFRNYGISPFDTDQYDPTLLKVGDYCMYTSYTDSPLKIINKESDWFTLMDVKYGSIENKSVSWAHGKLQKITGLTPSETKVFDDKIDTHLAHKEKDMPKKGDIMIYNGYGDNSLGLVHDQLVSIVKVSAAKQSAMVETEGGEVGELKVGWLKAPPANQKPSQLDTVKQTAQLAGSLAQNIALNDVVEDVDGNKFDVVYPPTKSTNSSGKMYIHPHGVPHSASKEILVSVTDYIKSTPDVIETKFKLGDKVKIMKGVLKDTIGHVMKIHADNTVDVMSEYDLYKFLQTGDIELYTEPSNKTTEKSFEVGDYVKIKSGYLEDSTGKITQVDNGLGSYTVKLDGGSSYEYHAEEIELLSSPNLPTNKTEEEPEPTEFLLGDQVLYKNSNFTYYVSNINTKDSLIQVSNVKTHKVSGWYPMADFKHDPSYVKI